MKKDLLFENDNGRTYSIIAGNDHFAFLRDMDRGKYVIARGLNWETKCWAGGSYFNEDEFGIAVKAFMES